MSLNEILFVVASGAVGAIAGSVAVYLNERRKIKSSAQSSRTELDVAEKEPASNALYSAKLDEKQNPQRVIPRGLLEKNKKELKTLQLEKQLVSAALTRLYEAEAAKEITREEREIIGLKYREELKVLDEKIGKIEALVEVGDLETLRDQLFMLVNQKIEAIDRRIERTKQIAEPLIAQILKQEKPQPPRPSTEPVIPKPRVPDISDMLEKEGLAVEPSVTTVSVVTQGQSTENQSSEKESDITVPVSGAGLSQEKSVRRRTEGQNLQVDELQKEIMEALDRLEKLDVES